jgi:uncharacterized membrane protein YeaQ/YmgE (transglycosylase-associated protein family)
MIGALVMINIIIWLIVGAIVGWQVGRLTWDQKDILRTTIIGSIGALSGGIVVNLFGKDSPNMHIEDLSISSLIMALVCACVLLGIVNMFRASSIR